MVARSLHPLTELDASSSFSTPSACKLSSALPSSGHVFRSPARGSARARQSLRRARLSANPLPAPSSTFGRQKMLLPHLRVGKARTGSQRGDVFVCLRRIRGQRSARPDGRGADRTHARRPHHRAPLRATPRKSRPAKSRTQKHDDPPPAALSSPSNNATPPPARTSAPTPPKARPPQERRIMAREPTGMEPAPGHADLRSDARRASSCQIPRCRNQEIDIRATKKSWNSATSYISMSPAARYPSPAF